MILHAGTMKDQFLLMKSILIEKKILFNQIDPISIFQWLGVPEKMMWKYDERRSQNNFR